MTGSSRFTTDRLGQMFKARSIALVGATEKSAWATTLIDNLERAEYSGQVHLVNRRGEPVFGRPTHTSVSALPTVPDVAYLLIRSALVLDALKEAHAAGVKNFVVLGAGFSEAGPAGQALQTELTDYCRSHDLGLLGPNNLGFANFTDGVVGYGLPLKPLPPAGGVSLVSQSGALAFELMVYIPKRGIGLDTVISVGNEAVIDIADCIGYAVDQPSTSVICVYAHAIRDPGAFRAACTRAAVAGKPVIIFKVGAGEQSAKAAVAHTGGLVGDDRVIDAAIRQSGAIRVDSIEAMVTTAALFDGYGELPNVRPAVFTGAGSSAEVFTDHADRLGFEVPAISAATEQRLRDAGLPDFATARNPLDVTGAVTMDAAAALPIMQRIMAEDPSVDILITQGSGFGNPAAFMMKNRRDSAKAWAALRASIGKPILIFSDLPGDAAPDAFELRNDFAIPPVIESVSRGLPALQRLAEWSRGRKRLIDRAQRIVEAPTPGPEVESGPWSEATTRDYLQRFSVPMAPSELVAAGTEVRSFEPSEFPLVAKICSPEIAHKTEIGGVVLNITSNEQLQDAVRLVTSRAMSARPDAKIEGVLVGPMRPAGIELLVGITRDDQWGPVLAVGLGGVWVEVLKDVSLRLLPVDHAEVVEMLEGLRAAPLLKGARGALPADLDAVADAVLAITRAAWAIRDSVGTLEVNPLVVRGAEVEALDAFVEFRE